ncbi:hypothetical protein ACEN2P_03445 [Pedobacter psychrotolerans]|uniref:hypothetical protein n=1 Tax=Pedobacter psychrotolerans TaxID=1843235 RepID=UPI003F954B22
MKDTTVAVYINRLFPQFEPALKDILIENALLKDFQGGDMLMQTGQNMRSMKTLRIWIRTRLTLFIVPAVTDL